MAFTVVGRKWLRLRVFLMLGWRLRADGFWLWAAMKGVMAMRRWVLDFLG